MKRVLLLYTEENYNLDVSLIANLLKLQFNEKNISCEVEIVNYFLTSEKDFAECDFVAGYNLDVDHELLLSNEFVGRYLHFFDSHGLFKFCTVSKREEMGGYNTYKISQVQV